MKPRNRKAVGTSADLPPALTALLPAFMPHEHFPTYWLRGPVAAPYLIAAQRFVMDSLGREAWHRMEHRDKLLSAFYRAWRATHPDYQPPSDNEEDDT